MRTPLRRLAQRRSNVFCKKVQRTFLAPSEPFSTLFPPFLPADAERCFYPRMLIYFLDSFLIFAYVKNKEKIHTRTEGETE